MHEWLKIIRLKTVPMGYFFCFVGDGWTSCLSVYKNNRNCTALQSTVLPIACTSVVISVFCLNGSISIKLRSTIELHFIKNLLCKLDRINLGTWTLFDESVFINALFISSWHILSDYIFAVGLGGYMSLATAELLVQITILSRMLCQPPKFVCSLTRDWQSQNDW